MQYVPSGVGAKEVEEYLAYTHMGEVGGKLAIIGHLPIAGPLDRLRKRRNCWQFYEETATLAFSFLMQSLRPRVVFDVGTGDGYFSRVAASHLDSQAMVHAFEMRSDYAGLASKRLNHGGFDSRVIVHRAALSDRHEGERDIWYCGTKVFETEPQPKEWQQSPWVRLERAITNDRRPLCKARVTLTSTDHFVSKDGIVPGLLKIDVGGYEAKVLRGALQTLSDHRPAIALELHKDKLIRTGSRRSVVAMLTDIGYRALFLTDRHDCTRCRVIPVDANHALVARQETDFLLLV